MNIPTKVLRSTFINNETYFHHQNLARKFYKSSGKNVKKYNKTLFSNDYDFRSQDNYDQISYLIGDSKHNYKEEILKWLFSMSLPERIKVVSIENKWFSTMVLQMYSKFKSDSKIKFQLKLEDVTTEEICLQQMFNSNLYHYNNEINIENFFNTKSDKNTDTGNINESLFLKELRYFSLRESNDTITLSSHLLEDEDMFRFFLETFSKNKAFQTNCTVSFDNVLKVYNWDFPKWFDTKEYNTISEFVAAYLEQVLSIRHWFSMELKKEKCNKQASYSLSDDPNFNEIFENREKLIQFLKSEYSDCKEKLLTSVIDLKGLLNEMKQDSALMAKIKKPRPDNIKNYFYFYNKQTKFELFEPPVDADYEIIEKFKKSLEENTLDNFIDDLIFTKLENISTLEDYLAKKIYDLIQNVYSEKNAYDLINEEMILKQSNSENKIKKKKSKKHENRRKRSGSFNKININKNNEVTQIKNSSLDEKKSSIGKPINIIHNEKFNSSDENAFEKNKKKIINNNIKKTINNESTEERNSSNNDNTIDKHDNEISSDELSTGKKNNLIEKDGNYINQNFIIEKDCILTVNLPDNSKLVTECSNGSNLLGVSNKSTNNNKNNNSNLNNKMSWRKMTKDFSNDDTEDIKANNNISENKKQNKYNQKKNTSNNNNNKGMKLQTNKLNKNALNNNYNANLNKVQPSTEFSSKISCEIEKEKSPEPKSEDSPDNVSDTNGYVTNLVKNMFNKIITDEGTLSFLNDIPKENKECNKDDKNIVVSLKNLDENSFNKTPIFKNNDIIIKNENNLNNLHENIELNLNKDSSINSNISIQTNISNNNSINKHNKNKNHNSNNNNNFDISRQNSDDNVSSSIKKVNNTNTIKVKYNTNNNIENKDNKIRNNNDNFYNNQNNKNKNNHNNNNYNKNNNNNNENKEKDPNSNSTVNSDKIIIKGKNFNMPPINQQNQTQNKNNYFERYNSNLNINNNNTNNNSSNNNNGFKEVGAKKSKIDNKNKNSNSNNFVINNNNNNQNVSINKNKNPKNIYNHNEIQENTIKKNSFSSNPISNLNNINIVQSTENRDRNSLNNLDKISPKKNTITISNYTLNKNNNDSFTITNEKKFDEISLNKTRSDPNNSCEKQIHHSKNKSFNNDIDVKIEKSINHEIIQKKTLMVDNYSQTELKKLMAEKAEKENILSKENSSTSLSIVNDYLNKNSKNSEFECQTDIQTENEEESNVEENNPNKNLRENENKYINNENKNIKKSLNFNNNNTKKEKNNKVKAGKVIGMFANESSNPKNIVNNNNNTNNIGNNNKNINGINKTAQNTKNTDNINNNQNYNNSQKTQNKSINNNIISNPNSNSNQNLKTSFSKNNNNNCVSNLSSGSTSFTSGSATTSNNSNNNTNNKVICNSNQEPVSPTPVPQSLNDILNPGGNNKNTNTSNNNNNNYDNYSSHKIYDERKNDQNNYGKKYESFNINNKNTNYRKGSFYNNNNNQNSNLNNNENTDDNDYFEQDSYRDPHHSRYGKPHSFNKGYFPYSKRGKNSFYNPNKFNNGLDSNMLINKQLNGRPYYQRGNPFEYNNYNYNFNFGMNNFEQDEFNNGYKKDPQIFNNYFIINSNININGVGNNTLNSINGNIINNNTNNSIISNSNNTNNIMNDNNLSNNNQNIDNNEKKDVTYSNNNNNNINSNYNNSNNVLNNINLNNLNNICYNPNNVNNNVNNTKDEIFNSPSRIVNNTNSFNQPGMNFYPQYFNGMGFVYNNMINFGMNDFANPHGQMLVFPNYLYGQPSNPSIITNKNIGFEFNNDIKKTTETHDNKNSLSLTRIYEDIHPFIFHYKLHNDILDYSNAVNEIVEFMKEIKKYIIRDLESIIKKCLDYKDFNVEIYGSFVTDLSIESSDIDMTIKMKNELEAEEIGIDTLMDKLCESFTNNSLIESVNPITTASVPVIKILIDPLVFLNQDSEERKKYEEFLNSDAYKNYKFDINELHRIKVDLTFLDFKQNKSQTTKNSLEWAKNTLSIYPEIKPIIHVLKRFLQTRKLNSSFNGGLSSFSLFILIVAYLKYPKIKTKTNLGRIIMEFFELFGKFFNYAQVIIDINNVYGPFVFSNDYLETIPVILDPLTGLNVAKNSFRIEEVRESFSKAYDYLSMKKISFDKKDLPTFCNVIFDLIFSNSK